MRFKTVIEAVNLARTFIRNNNNDPYSKNIKYFICYKLELYPYNFQKVFIREIERAQDFKQQIAQHKASKRAA